MKSENDLAPEMDEELADLLDEIDEEELEEQEVPPSVTVDQESESNPILVDPELNEKQELELPAPIEPEIPEPVGAQNIAINLAETFMVTVNDVLSNSALDREQLQEAIEHFGTIVAAGGKIPGVVLEQWVAAMSKKADINISNTKALDSVAKFLAAAKNNQLLMGDDFIGEEVDFDEILSRE